MHMFISWLFWVGCVWCWLCRVQNDEPDFYLCWYRLSFMVVNTRNEESIFKTAYTGELSGFCFLCLFHPFSTVSTLVDFLPIFHKIIMTGRYAIVSPRTRLIVLANGPGMASEVSITVLIWYNRQKAIVCETVPCSVGRWGRICFGFDTHKWKKHSMAAALKKSPLMLLEILEPFLQGSICPFSVRQQLHRAK